MFNIYYYKNPRYSDGKIIIATRETEREAHSLCIAFEQDGGYEDENGIKHSVDFEEV
jgi:hypothetical protein